MKYILFYDWCLNDCEGKKGSDNVFESDTCLLYLGLVSRLFVVSSKHASRPSRKAISACLEK